MSQRRWGWVAFGVALGALFVAERRRPLRRQKEPGAERVGRNLAIGMLAGATTAASEMPLVAPVQRLAERGRLGLLRRLPLPRALRVVLGFLLLDYTLYLWHWLNHRVAVPLALPRRASRRSRSGHAPRACGFISVSSRWPPAFARSQVLLLGVDRETLRLWQQMLVVSVIFHHSNLELPIETEALLNAVVVTPRMHGIHHSTRADETDSNYSSLLSCWDRLHRSLRLDVPQSAVTIGVAGFSDAGRRDARAFADAAVS